MALWDRKKRNLCRGWGRSEKRASCAVEGKREKTKTES